MELGVVSDGAGVLDGGTTTPPVVSPVRWLRCPGPRRYRSPGSGGPSEAADRFASGRGLGGLTDSGLYLGCRRTGSHRVLQRTGFTGRAERNTDRDRAMTLAPDALTSLSGSPIDGDSRQSARWDRANAQLGIDDANPSSAARRSHRQSGAGFRSAPSRQRGSPRCVRMERSGLPRSSTWSDERADAHHRGDLFIASRTPTHHRASGRESRLGSTACASR
jgi:hypothetical protein